MKRFIKILILPVAVTAVFGFAPKVFAVSPMTVIFAPNPIFGEVINFLPGDSKDGDATVTNNTDEEQDIYAESVNGFDPDGLGSQLRLRVLEGATVLYDDVFSNFLSAGPVPLSSLDGGDTTIYTFEVSFIDSADNDYMGKSLGFDLCIGFSGGTFQCGDTVISDEEPVDEDAPPSGTGDGGGTINGSGGSSSGGTTQLLIFNEQATDINASDGTAVITWNTNLLATSQVVYGPTPPSYNLDLNAVYFGYPSGTLETTTKVVNHSVTLTGLVSGGTYKYRVVSRASPPTISPEHTFTLAQSSSLRSEESPGIQEFRGISATDDTPSGVSTGDTSSEGQGGSVEEDSAATSSQSALSQLAAAFLGFEFPGLICISVALIIFLIMLGLVWLISRNKKEKSLAKDTILLVIFGLITSFVLWLIPYTCSIVPLWTIVAVYIIGRFISNRYFTRPN